MSILDREEDIINDDEYIVKHFIKENYTTSKLIINRLEDGSYEVDCIEVIVKNKLIEHLTNNLFKWGESCTFDARNCTALRTLEGAPKKCVIFTCEGCISLESLEGAPKDCPSFDCRNCSSLKDLKGSPKYLAPASITGCYGLKSFEGAPERFMQKVLNLLMEGISERF